MAAHIASATTVREEKQMRYVPLGNSGLTVSVLSFGTMTFGGTGWAADIGRTGVDDARRQLDICIEAGVNLIDTADIYSDGWSEEILGEAIEPRRNEVLIATKARFPMGEGPNDGGLSRHHLIRACEASLRRLRTDHIDLYQAHEWDGQTPIDETLAAFDHLVTQGKVRYIGLSNFTGWQFMKVMGRAQAFPNLTVASHQVYYSLQARESEYEIAPAAIDQGVGLMVWSPLAGGLLSGKFRRQQNLPEGARLTANWGDPPIFDEDRMFDMIEVLVEVAQSHSVSAAQVALAWLLTRPAVATVIVGARHEEQLRDNLAAVDLVLTPNDLARLDKASVPNLIYPYWHQAETANDRLSAADLSLLGPYIPWTGVRGPYADQDPAL